MKLWKWLLSPAMLLSLVVPGAVYAQGEVADDAEDYTSSFQNPTQAERAQRIAEGSVDKAAAEAIAEQQAEDYVKQVSSDYADAVVEKISSEHADRIVDEKSSDHADSIVEEKSLAYATAQADATRYEPGSDKYNAVKRDAYNEAKARATAEGDWENLWETAKNEAKARATAEGEWENLWETAKNDAYARATAEGDWENAKETAYQKALAEEIARVTEVQLEEVKRLRLDEGLGWGVLVKVPGIELHPSINGRGRYKNMKRTLPVDEIAPRDPEAIPLDDEIAQVTKRNIHSGWDKGEVSTQKRGKSKKWVGLTEPSLEARSAIAETDGGYEKGSNGKSDSSVGASKSNKSNKSQSSLSTSTNPSGKDKNSSKNNGSKNNSSKNNGSKNNSSDKGKSGKSNNGNGNGNK